MTFNPEQCQAVVAPFPEYQGGNESFETYLARRTRWEQRRRNKAFARGFEFEKCSMRAKDKIEGVGYCGLHSGIILRNALRNSSVVDTTLSI